MEMEMSEDKTTLLQHRSDKQDQYQDELDEEERFSLHIPSTRSRLLQIPPLYFGVAVALIVFLLGTYSSLSTNGEGSSINYCRWQFSHYEPSKYEQTWVDNSKSWQHNVCDKVAEPVHAKASRLIVSRSLELAGIDDGVNWATQDNQPLSLEAYKSESDDYFSRMHYSRECYKAETNSWIKASGSGIQLIEPLWGMLRDPFDLFCYGKKLILEKGTTLEMQWKDQAGQSKQHIISQGFSPYTYTLTNELLTSTGEWRSHGTPPWISSLAPSTDPQAGTVWKSPKNVLLDLGSSYFGSWRGATNAASGSWMYKTFHQRGLKWDKYVAVEVEALSPPEAYKQLPDDLVGVYTFMNVPLNVEKYDKLNVISLLRSIANSNDHVVLKLDIDSADMELPFAHALRDDPSLGALVSEMYFEHHVDLEPMRSSWGTGIKEDLVDSYRLFQALRSNGIRAHSWP